MLQKGVKWGFFTLFGKQCDIFPLFQDLESMVGKDSYLGFEQYVQIFPSI